MLLLGMRVWVGWAVGAAEAMVATGAAVPSSLVVFPGPGCALGATGLELPPQEDKMAVKKQRKKINLFNFTHAP